MLIKRNISATIITLNEASNIVECIQSAQQICKDVVVLDSESTDNTKELSEKAGARYFQQSYLGDGPQKKKSSQYALYDWVFSLDADERFESDALQFISNISLTNEKIAYSFYRKNFVGKHQIKAPGFHPDIVTRLYNRKYSGYTSRKYHAHVQAETIQRTHTHLTHYTYEDYNHWIERIKNLSDRDAWTQTERKINRYSPITHSFTAFIRKLILQGGILRGVDGWTVAWTTALKTHFKYLKILEKQKK